MPFTDIKLADGCTSSGEDGLGAARVHNATDSIVLEGTVQFAKTPAKNDLIGNLPFEAKPRTRKAFAVLTGKDSIVPGRIDVTPQGEILYVAGDAAFINLDGISYVADKTIDPENIRASV